MKTKIINNFKNRTLNIYMKLKNAFMQVRKTQSISILFINYLK